MQPILIITGPTASGKSAVAMHCARLLGAEIVSADSRQVYRGLDIGTAKPGADELREISHHGIDIAEPGETYTAGRFFEDARGWISDILARGRRVIVSGGSGLYVRTLTHGIFDAPDVDPDLRAELQRRLDEEGADALIDDLEHLDPEAARSIDTRNPVRLLRALEVCHQTGEHYSAIRRERMRTLPWRFVQTAIERERAELYDRINGRVDAMVAAGLFDEVRALLAAGVQPSWNALKTVGYQEIVEYFENLHSREHAIELIKRNTRRFAKRQLTWFRREEDLRWFAPEPAGAGMTARRMLAEVSGEDAAAARAGQ